MAHAKDRHYWIQLRSTVTAGSWDASFPAKAPNGTPLSWSELLRKFNKHCTGYTDVAELVSQTQALSLLLAANAKDLDSDEGRPPNDLSLGSECLLPEERIEEGVGGYSVLQNLQSSKTEPVTLALAYYAYALGRPSETLELLADVNNLANVQARIAAYGTMRSDPLSLQAPLPGADSTSSSWTGTLSSAATIPESDVGDGKAWATAECVRSLCLRGMSHEKLCPDEPEVALSAYKDAIPVIELVSTEIQTTPATASTLNVAEARSPSGSFARYRELWRWIERLLRRAIILASYTNDVTQSNSVLWTFLTLYRACSVHWPASFRPELRSTVATLHLRALVLRAHCLPPDQLKLKAPRWISTARSVLQEFRALLSVCTHFPRAGERNVRVEDFVDLCVATWEADGAVGEYAGWVIDFLWWATRLTFNSFRVYRHMTRLLAVSGDPELARRTLRLYIQVVSKAREAGNSETSRGAETDSGVEMDSDKQWVQTLIWGSRLLCRSALSEPDYGKAVDMAKEAGAVLEKARISLDLEDTELVASMRLAEGVWHSVMAFAQQDPKTRATHLAESLSLLSTSIETLPTASAHHHLALALARPGASRDIHMAIEHARSAVEADSNELRHWHLLALLLAATGDWRAAKGVLDVGIGLAEADLSEDDQHQHPLAGTEANGTINIRDFGRGTVDGVDGLPETANGHATAAEHVQMNGQNGHVEHATTVPPRSVLVPPSSGLLQPIRDRVTPSRQECFEYALQMRMTQLALTEFVEGAEGVGEKWLEVFQWFREQRPASMDDRRKSIDSRRVSQDTRPSESLSARGQPPMPTVDEPPDSAASVHNGSSLTAIPIRVTPASPGVDSTEFVVEQRSQLDGVAEKRSSSLDEKERDNPRGKGKKVKEVLKSGVHKSQARITTISKKIGHGVGRHGSLNLKRITSAPDMHSLLGQAPYQASSIHLRQYHSIHASQQDLSMLDLPPPPPASTPEPVDAQKTTNVRAKKDRRLLSDLWLMSAAIFRRLGKIEQAKAAIQEAEVRDEDNPAVWVQLGLYYVALGEENRATEAFQKALFIDQNNVSATVYLCRIYLSQAELSLDTNADATAADTAFNAEDVDLAAGLLEDLTRGPGWDVPEAWYFLAKAYKLQGRRDRERECLSFALSLSETRGVRDVTSAVGWCL